MHAIVPVKLGGAAKTRLGAPLDAGERRALCECMARDVLGALRGATGLAGIVLATTGDGADALAAEFGCRVLQDPPGADLRSGVQHALDRLATEGAGGALVVPGDLPALTPGDVEALLGQHRAGLTLVAAARDGGTNALVLTPPDAVPCQYGADSARRHLEAAAASGVAARQVDIAGFARDLDTVDDVLWLCGPGGRGHAREYLLASGICQRLAAGSGGNTKTS
ncbi:MAG: 2-phospho-L-lactate guanylyltransferase [Gammaproteobacteria bacterium]|nr:2-phospho-L-lactate guanylyltransferase [Gammaproteobacteria bacterium]